MFFSNKYGYSEMGKYVFNPTDENLIIITKDKNVKVDDEIYYYTVVDEKYIISSNKIININKEMKLYTLSDNSNITSSKIIGKSIKKIPVVGYILNSLKEKMNFLLFVLIPIFIVFVYQVYKFIVGIGYERIKE